MFHPDDEVVGGAVESAGGSDGVVVVGGGIDFAFGSVADTEVFDFGIGGGVAGVGHFFGGEQGAGEVVEGAAGFALVEGGEDDEAGVGVEEFSGGAAF